MGKTVGHSRSIISRGARMCVFTVVNIKWEQMTVKEWREEE